jgi:hypothetical protein
MKSELYYKIADDLKIWVNQMDTSHLLAVSASHCDFLSQQTVFSYDSNALKMRRSKNMIKTTVACFLESQKLTVNICRMFDLIIVELKSS